MKTLHDARKEMTTKIAELRIKHTLLSRVSKNADLMLETSDRVCVYKKTDRKYMEPLSVVRIDGKQVFPVQGEK